MHLKAELLSQGPVIQADGAHIKQILTNLISNALEAFGEAEGHITVAAGDIRKSRSFPMDWKPKAKSYACLSVSDSGCGMDSATLEKIFDPFFFHQVHGPWLGVARYSGSGAGA